MVGGVVSGAWWSRWWRYVVAVLLVGAVVAGVSVGGVVRSRSVAVREHALVQGEVDMLVDGFTEGSRGFRSLLNGHESSGLGGVVSVRSFVCGDGFTCYGFVLTGEGRRVLPGIVSVYGRYSGVDVSADRLVEGLYRPSYELGSKVRYTSFPGRIVVPQWVSAFISWTAKPARVRNTRTGKVQVLDISRWMFLKDKQKGVVVYSDWELVK